MHGWDFCKFKGIANLKKKEKRRICHHLRTLMFQIRMNFFLLQNTLKNVVNQTAFFFFFIFGCFDGPEASLSSKSLLLYCRDTGLICVRTLQYFDLHMKSHAISISE